MYPRLLLSHFVQDPAGKLDDLWISNNEKKNEKKNSRIRAIALTEYVYAHVFSSVPRTTLNDVNSNSMYGQWSHEWMRLCHTSREVYQSDHWEPP
jgi:ribonucleotide reductase beta subunit family protein with ferritin-like domain